MCVRCPREKIAWIPGSNSPDQCLTYNQHKALLRDISLNLQLLQKLSPRSRMVSRRALIEATTYGEPNALTPSPPPSQRVGIACPAKCDGGGDGVKALV